MQEASAKGKAAQFKDRNEVVAPDRPGTWPERVMGKDASPEPPQARIGKGTRSRPSDCARQRTSEASGFERAQQGRSESRMPARAPVTNLWQGRPQGAGSERLDIGRQAWPGSEGKPKVRRRLSKRKVIHALVRVGSAAMPAPFALYGPVRSPSVAFARVALHQKRTPMAAGRPRFQRFIAFPGQLVPQQTPHGDEIPTWFAFCAGGNLSAPPCGREIAPLPSRPVACAQRWSPERSASRRSICKARSLKPSLATPSPKLKPSRKISASSSKHLDVWRGPVLGFSSIGSAPPA